MLNRAFRSVHFSKFVNAYSLWTGLNDGYEYRHGSDSKKNLNAVDTALSFIAFSSLGASIASPIKNYFISSSISYLAAEHVKKDIESAQAVFKLRSTGS